MPGRSIGLLFQGWSRGNPASIPNYTICRLGSNPRSRGVYRVAYDPDAEALGSSALARGLRGLPLQPGPQDRIIPARAGFTRGDQAGLGPRQDHPRSRGVYEADGSVRGLPERIIPARAGFTDRTGRTRHARRDHPRSRGVYRPDEIAALCGEGSSPLARGLPGPPPILPCRPRIIPARAGFTPDAPADAGSISDHPRSRGVYLSCCRRSQQRPGSSPLARGLRTAGPTRSGRARIIPARAGFTTHRC